MKGLFYKDLVSVTKTYRSIFLIILVFLGASFLSKGNLFWASYAAFMGCTMVATMQNIDETSKWCRMCDTLPVTRSDMVREKFLFNTMINLGIIGVYLIMAVIASLFRLAPEPADILVSVVTMWIAGIISSSCTLTTAFLFGPQRSQLMRVVMIVVFVMVCMSLINYVPGFMEFLKNTNPMIIIPLALALPVVIQLLSIMIASAGFEKRIL